MKQKYSLIIDYTLQTIGLALIKTIMTIMGLLMISTKDTLSSNSNRSINIVSQICPPIDLSLSELSTHNKVY